MTTKDQNALSNITGNPRFLDRLNAVCTAVLALLLLAFVALALQSRAHAAVVVAPVDAATWVGHAVTVAPASVAVASTAGN